MFSELLKCGWFGLSCSVCVKYTPNIQDLVGKIYLINLLKTIDYWIIRQFYFQFLKEIIPIQKFEYK